DLSDPVCGGPDGTAPFGVPRRLRHADGDAVRADAGGGGDTAAERDQLRAAVGRPDTSLLALVRVVPPGGDAGVAGARCAASGKAGARVELRDFVASDSRRTVTGGDRHGDKGGTGNDGLLLHVVSPIVQNSRFPAIAQARNEPFTRAIVSGRGGWF